MKVQNEKMIAMESLFKKIRKGGLNPKEIKELAELSSHFLFIAKAGEFISLFEPNEKKPQEVEG